MLSEVKTALRIKNTTAYDQDLLRLIRAGIADLGVVGAYFAWNVQKTDGVITDYTITDPLVAEAVITFCRVNFGSPDDYDRMKASYDEQKGQLRCNRKYTREVC